MTSPIKFYEIIDLNAPDLALLNPLPISVKKDWRGIYTAKLSAVKNVRWKVEGESPQAAISALIKSVVGQYGDIEKKAGNPDEAISAGYKDILAALQEYIVPAAASPEPVPLPPQGKMFIPVLTTLVH